MLFYQNTKMVIITGVGRCGTSLLAKVCKMSGLITNFGNWYEAYNAGGEHTKSIQINERIIRAKVKNEQLFAYELRDDIESIDDIMFKDPRFLYEPDIIKTWYAIRSDIKILYLYRDPNAIVASSKAAPLLNSPNFRNHKDLILKNHNQFLINIKKLGIEYRVLHFPSFIDAYDKVYDDICHLTQMCSLSFRENWDKVVNKKLVHH